MAFVNYNNKEITAKIVYYGPALSGKTTCLRWIYNCHEIDNKGKLITLDTDGDRTLFFDFLPLKIGKLGNYSIKIQLYTVPGQVAYDTTRKLVLQGADGVVFVADSQVIIRDQNIESLINLKKNLKLNNLAFEEIPLIYQFNKRDLKEILPVDTLNRDLNPDHKSSFPTVATSGENVLDGLYAIIKMVIINLKNKLSLFQKDKTVMFSREEITSTTPKGNEEKDEPEELIDGAIKADTEEEEVFELSSPVVSPGGEAKPPLPLGDEEIFKLDESREIRYSTAEIDVPDFNFDLELGNGAPAKPPGKVLTASAAPEPAAKRFDEPLELNLEQQIQSNVKNFDIPINIQFPKSQQEIKVNLNLKITIKKA